MASFALPRLVARSLAIVLCVAVLALGLHVALSHRQPSGAPTSQKVPPLRVAPALGTERPLGFSFDLKGDPDGASKATLSTRMTAYRLSPPRAMSKDDASTLARERFGLTARPLEHNVGTVLAPEIRWDWDDQNTGLHVDPESGSFWSQHVQPPGTVGRDSDPNQPKSPLDPSLRSGQALEEAARIGREWLRQHQIPEGQGEPGDVLILDPQSGEAAWMLFQTKIDGITVYPSSATVEWGAPSTVLMCSGKSLSIGMLHHYPRREVVGKQECPLRSAQAAWDDVIELPAEHMRYFGFVQDNRAAGVRLVEPIDQWNHYGLGGNAPREMLTSPVTVTLTLNRVESGYAYAGDPGPLGPLYLVPVYAFEARGPGAEGRVMAAVFLSSAVADDYVQRWMLPRPQSILVYKDGRALTLAETAAGYEQVYAAAVSALDSLSLDYLTGLGLEDAGSLRQNEFGVELVYGTPDAAPARIETDLGLYTVDHLLVPLSTDTEAAAKVWVPAPSTDRYWLATSQKGIAGLRKAVEAAIAGRQDWGRIPEPTRLWLPAPAVASATPSPASPTPTPSTNEPSWLPTPGPALPISTEDDVWNLVARLTSVSPVLCPQSPPSGLEMVQMREAGQGTFWVEYNGPGKRLGIGAGAFNPDLPTPDGEQRRVAVRGQETTMQIRSKADPSQSVLLWWDEPGRWNADDRPEPGHVFYLISAEGISPDVVLQLANSLRAVPQRASE